MQSSDAQLPSGSERAGLTRGILLYPFSFAGSLSAARPCGDVGAARVGVSDPLPFTAPREGGAEFPGDCGATLRTANHDAERRATK